MYLLDFTEKYSLSLLNIPGEGTFYRLHISTPSVLDLTFATQGIVNKVIDWQIMPDLGSDHFGVLFIIIQGPTSYISTAQRYNTSLVNWELSKETLIKETYNLSLKTSTSYQTNSLDTIANKFTSIIVKAADISIPKKKITIIAKP